MPEFKDILLNRDYELQFEEGDFKIGASNYQEIELILKANPGHFYQWPEIGFGVDNYLAGPVQKNLIEKRIRKQLFSDNLIVSDLIIDIVDDRLEISVNAERIQ